MDYLALIRHALFTAAVFFLSAAWSSVYAFTYTINSHGFTASGGSVAEVAVMISTAYNRSGKVSCSNSAGQAVGFWAMEINSYDYVGKKVAITVRRTYNGPALCGDLAIPDTIPFTVSGVNTCYNDDKLVDPAPCNATPCPTAGTVEGDASNAYTSNGMVPPSSLCIGTCSWVGSGSVPAVCGNGKCYTFGPFKSQGTACTPSAGGGQESPIPKDPPAEKATDTAAGCMAKAQCPVLVNGIVTCGKCTSTGSTSATQSATAASSAASGSSSITQSKSNDGTVKTTICTDGKCTTTEYSEKTDPSGLTVKEKKETKEDQGQFCQKNPTDPQCKKADSSVSGSCGAVSCDGDAIQCAIVREQAKRNCELMDTQTDMSRMGVDIANGSTRPSGHPGLEAQSVNISGTFDTSNPYGNSCPPDFTMNAYGHAVTVPLSSACGVLQFMGYIAVAFAMYAGGRIALGGIA